MLGPHDFKAIIKGPQRDPQRNRREVKMSDKPSFVTQNSPRACYSCCRPANPTMFSNSQLAKLEDGVPARCKECISGEMGQSSSSANLPPKNAKCVYLRGVNRTCTADSIATHFASIGEIDRIEFQGGGEGTSLLSLPSYHIAILCHPVITLHSPPRT